MQAPACDPCPLCTAQTAISVASTPYDVIWRGLQTQWSATFTDDVVHRHQPSAATLLVRCRGCELEYFTPLVPGDTEFYTQLMARTPYHSDRWEFGEVLDRTPPGAAVVDLGCGDGAFLRRAGRLAGRVVGVDHNADAIASLAELEIESHAQDFGVFAQRNRASFDLACSFHTLEHLPSVAELIGAARVAVRPGGRIFVSVPNRGRYGRRGDEPMDCPPHHVSRWGPQQLRFLADRFELELVDVLFEEPDFSNVWERARRASRRFLEPVGARSDRHLLVRAWMKAAVGPRRHARAARAGRYTARGIFGHSMMAELKVPE